jgi:outer membrane protein
MLFPESFDAIHEQASSLSLASLLAGGLAQAQTPATNPMPDGSRDMYVGLGVQSAPRYEGTGSRKVSALPVLQVEWSNGVFISGMSAGMHLSNSPTVEVGPLLAVLPGRDESGTGAVVGGVNNSIINTIGPRARKRWRRPGAWPAWMRSVRACRPAPSTMST